VSQKNKIRAAPGLAMGRAPAPLSLPAPAASHIG